MNLEQPNLTKNKEKKPENLEEANGIIESLKGRVSYLEKWGKRGALLFLTVSGLLINSGIEKNKEGKEKKLIEEEFKKLKTSIEKATFHFERHELGKGILVKDKDKIVIPGSVEKMQEATNANEQDAFAYLNQAQEQADGLKKILKYKED